MLPTQVPPAGRNRAAGLLAWTLAAAALVAASWCMPLFSRQDPGGGTLSYPPLYPVYFQSNLDAPLEMQTCLGFPGFYREHPYRISRPTLYAAVAGVRNFLFRPLAGLILGPDPVRWGQWPARDFLATYLLWLLANLGFLLVSARMALSLVTSKLPGAAAPLAVLMFISTPIALLAIREIHLNAFQIFTGMACLAFWNAVLGGRLSGRGMVLASLGLGLAFLGKPSLNLFGAGAALGLLAGQGRKLLLVLPAAALPTLLWMAAVKAMGLEYAVPEVTEWRAGIWIFAAGPAGAARELALYTAAWARAMGESLTPVHLPLAVLGAYSLWMGRPAAPGTAGGPGGSPGRRFLALTALIASADFVFYFLVHRVHAAYYMGTLLGLFALASTGLLYGLDRALDRLSARPGLVPGEAGRFRLALAAVILMQAALLARQLPRYPG